MLKKSLAIAFISLAMAVSAKASTNASQPVEGIIIEVVAGEISVGLGDACLFNIETTDHKRIALFTDFDACVDAEVESDAYAGKSIRVATGNLWLIEGARVIRMLKDFDDSFFYIYADFDGIMDGLK